ncbi:MAG: choloylglycine hydrolase [Bacillota bacterium]|nr:choloylglycine hydrolase [Bacillota bacterium]
MCTAVTYKTKCFYFGRTLDYEFSYGDEVVVLPRNYPLKFRHAGELKSHHAIIGMAYVTEEMPLFYDAVNEKGLAIAGLNFVGNACYNHDLNDRDNITQFELVPWILGQCASVNEAEKLLNHLNLTDESFSDDIPVAQLHWLIADKNRAITVEFTKDGMSVYDNPVGALTNNPPFNYQMFALNNYMGLSPEQPDNNFGIKLDAYSRGMGGIGLPGDLSSQSRFIKVAYTKMHSQSGSSETESVSQFFHILGSVDQQNGCCNVGNEKYEITLYTSCCNTDKGIYYYTTYNNHQISAVDMHRENLDGKDLARYPVVDKEVINYIN